MKPLGCAVLALIFAAATWRAFRVWLDDLDAALEHLFEPRP